MVGSPWENLFPKGNILIISEDEDSSDPDDNHKGGVLTFDFPQPQPIDSIGFLDNERRTTFEIITSDGDSTLIDNRNGGDNSYELVPIRKQYVTRLIVTFYGSAAITEINYDPTTPKCTLYKNIDFSGFQAGEIVSSLDYDLSVKAFKRNEKNGPLVAGEAMIFDSSCPGGCTGDDFDLGTPHKSFGGPGIGGSGKKGSPYENSVAQGNILIISEDEDSSDPDDNEYGGQLIFKFKYFFAVNAIGILDNEKGVKIDVTTVDGGKTTWENGHGGNNSFESVQLWKPYVTKIVLTYPGSIGVTNLELAMCP
jgi:hypothetical protein